METDSLLFLNRLNKRKSITVDNIEVVMSEAGKLNQTPVIPKYFGSIIKNGIKKRNCLVKERKIEVFANPML